MVRIPHLILALLFVLPFSVNAQPPLTILAYKAEKKYQEAKTLVDQSAFTSALPLLDEVLELNPEHEWAYAVRGEVLFSLRQYEAAIDDYVTAFRQHPDQPDYMNEAGAAAMELQVYESAEIYFRKALEVDPNHLEASQNLAAIQDFLASRRNHSGGNTQPAQVTTGRPYQREGTITRPTQGGNRPTFNTGGNRPTFGKNEPSNAGSNTVNPSSTPNTGSAQQGNPEIVPLQRNRKYTRKEFAVGKQTDASFNIIQIQVTPQLTQITFEMVGVGEEPYDVHFDQIGGESAWRLYSIDYSKSYKLRGIRLPGWPNRPFTLNPGEKKVFTATFDPLDPGVNTFHLQEGSGQFKYAWNFYNIQLSPNP
ncbi:tetratricopeptide repeat protein [Pontibacter sp. G13]|uniref:tetratricopeptide repeat protein n=1 Tax=Pontibacter sp. G13 TaxID=3074898 RepID=UPI00288C56CD|nr:tetratricopeptide repeat protein [Pontibacter sp. G13]WNJ19826.1 tetratricopeptide repeat protein [Pontibacter sp. G13]